MFAFVNYFDLIVMILSFRNSKPRNDFIVIMSNSQTSSKHIGLMLNIMINLIFIFPLEKLEFILWLYAKCVERNMHFKHVNISYFKIYYDKSKQNGKYMCAFHKSRKCNLIYIFSIISFNLQIIA